NRFHRPAAALSRGVQLGRGHESCGTLDRRPRTVELGPWRPSRSPEYRTRGSARLDRGPEVGVREPETHPDRDLDRAKGKSPVELVAAAPDLAFQATHSTLALGMRLLALGSQSHDARSAELAARINEIGLGTARPDGRSDFHRCDRPARACGAQCMDPCGRGLDGSIAVIRATSRSARGRASGGLHRYLGAQTDVSG